MTKLSGFLLNMNCVCLLYPVAESVVLWSRSESVLLAIASCRSGVQASTSSQCKITFNVPSTVTSPGFPHFTASIQSCP